MRDLSSRLQSERKRLHLSQEYVARFIGIGRTAVAEIESGKRKVSAEELAKFSELFLVPADVLLHGNTASAPSQMFARGFDALSESDQQEILNLIEFKRAMMAKR